MSDFTDGGPAGTEEGLIPWPRPGNSIPNSAPQNSVQDPANPDNGLDESEYMPRTRFLQVNEHTVLIDIVNVKTNADNSETLRVFAVKVPAPLLVAFSGFVRRAFAQSSSPRRELRCLKLGEYSHEEVNILMNWMVMSCGTETGVANVVFGEVTTLKYLHVWKLAQTLEMHLALDKLIEQMPSDITKLSFQGTVTVWAALNAFQYPENVLRFALEQRLLGFAELPVRSVDDIAYACKMCGTQQWTWALVERWVDANLQGRDYVCEAGLYWHLGKDMYGMVLEMWQAKKAAGLM